MNVARLYRDILRAAARFPSVKRAAIIRDIKEEFHSNKVQKIHLLRAKSVVAYRGLERACRAMHGRRALHHAQRVPAGPQ